MNSEAGQQLALGVVLDDEARFTNYTVSETNAQAVAMLKPSAQEAGESVYLWGGRGCGRSHLLQASCHAHDSAIYVPLAELFELSPELLEGIGSLSLVCIDDLQAVAGRDDWERALFSLFNAIREQGGRLLVSANEPPASLALSLPDLRSRLQSLLIVQLAELQDEDKKRALQLRARGRGLELDDGVADFLLRRVGRDMHELLALLGKLDSASLRHQRRLSIPFVKQQLGL